jgi:hypothetical protein
LSVSDVVLLLYGVAFALLWGSMLISNWIHGDLTIVKGIFPFEAVWSDLNLILLLLSGLLFALSPLDRKLLGVLSLCLACVIGLLTVYGQFVEPMPGMSWPAGLMLRVAFVLLLLLVPSLYLLLTSHR